MNNNRNKLPGMLGELYRYDEESEVILVAREADEDGDYLIANGDYLTLGYVKSDDYRVRRMIEATRKIAEGDVYWVRRTEESPLEVAVVQSNGEFKTLDKSYSREELYETRFLASVPEDS